MVGFDAIFLVVLMLFWFRLVRKVGIVIVTGLEKYIGVKLMLEGIPVTVAWFKILKLSLSQGQLTCLTITEY